MSSDMLLFFKIGFLLTNEFDLDSLALLDWVGLECTLALPLWRGP
jgi:hypothetical protein